MEVQYYIQYILSWIYHNVIHTDATYAIIRIGIFIGLVTLLVYREYVWFVLLCIVILSSECFRWMRETKCTFDEVQAMISNTTASTSASVGASAGASTTAGIHDKDILTNGISLSSREGFSLGMPKIIQGDDSGTDHRRSNKFIEEDSNDFTEKYFKSKQCSIGSGIGGITMFGSNELIGESRTAQINTIYDFEGKSTSNDSNGSSSKRATYFMDCVYSPIKRSVNNGNDFRETKKWIYENINSKIIDINKCLSRFNTSILYDTTSNISEDRSTRLSLSDKIRDDDKQSYSSTDKYHGQTLVYKSLIMGNTNADKMSNIQPLDKGNAGDNINDQMYSNLLQYVNSDERFKKNSQLKQLHLNIYSKVYGYRKRINEILSIMREQTKNDAALLYTVRVNESIVQEIRMILGYLDIIQRTNDIILFETGFPFVDTTQKGIYAAKLDTTPPPSVLSQMPTVAYKDPTVKITNNDINRPYVNILKIPHEDDTYNSNDEKRYLYGITYYFGGRSHSS